MKWLQCCSSLMERRRMELLKGTHVRVFENYEAYCPFRDQLLSILLSYKTKIPNVFSVNTFGK